MDKFKRKIETKSKKCFYFKYYGFFRILDSGVYKNNPILVPYYEYPYYDKKNCVRVFFDATQSEGIFPTIFNKDKSERKYTFKDLHLNTPIYSSFNDHIRKNHFCIRLTRTKPIYVTYNKNGISKKWEIILDRKSYYKSHCYCEIREIK